MYHTYDHVRVIIRRRCSFALMLRESLKRTEMWIWYVFTESLYSTWIMTWCVQQWAVDHIFVLLGLCCNGSNSSCQVSLFSHVHEPCSTRQRKSCIMKRNTVLYFSSCYSSWLHINHIHPCCYRELLGLLKNESFSRTRLFFFPQACDFMACRMGCQVCVRTCGSSREMSRSADSAFILDNI